MRHSYDTLAHTIRAARHVGVVRTGMSARKHSDVLKLAKEFGLDDDPHTYTEIAPAQARRLLVRILHQDMAYAVPIMPETLSRELADQFLSQFTTGARFFSNGWGGPGAWCAATAATFDTGILVLGDDRSGCLWVEDQD